MKKSMVICLILSLFAHLSYGQKGISFEDISWMEALEKAKRTDKLIFVDAYTSWCMPCKLMDQEVFNLDSVGYFFNANFINLKIDMEKDPRKSIGRMYPVGSYPTYLFVDGKGEEIHRSGSRMDAGAFLTQARFALSPEFSLSAMKKRYESGDRNNNLLFKYALALKRKDGKLSKTILVELLDNLSEEQLKSQLGWDLINEFAESETDRLGTSLFRNEAFYAALVGVDKVNALTEKFKIKTINGLRRDGNEKEFFDRLNYFTRSDRSQLRVAGALILINYYLIKNNVDAFVKTSDVALNGLIADRADDLSFFARRIVRPGKITDIRLLKQAYKLSKKAVSLKADEYSIQGTHAEVCLSLKYKKEGLLAAGAALKLAEQKMTSKIQAAARGLYDRLNAL